MFSDLVRWLVRQLHRITTLVIWSLMVCLQMDWSVRWLVRSKFTIPPLVNMSDKICVAEVNNNNNDLVPLQSAAQ